MGKVITRLPDVTQVIDTPKGEMDFQSSFYRFISSAMDLKGPVDSLASVDSAIQVVRKIKAAEEKASDLVLEDAEFLVLDTAMKKYLPTLIPAVARAVRPFYRALEKQSDANQIGFQDADLAIKK
jgi:hypothetical protein